MAKKETKVQKEETPTTANIQNVGKLEGDSALKTVDIKPPEQDKSSENEEVAGENADEKTENETETGDENEAEADVDEVGDETETDEANDEDDEDEVETETEENIRFIGKYKPQTVVTVGRGQYIHLGADGNKQRAGFYHEHAETIIAQYPDIYEAI